jgi:DNA-binding CsgD family transcriptional regulator
MLAIIGGSAMGAVEHLKTLCCLRLAPESAMIAVTPLLHEIIPHGWTRMAFIKPDATLSHGYTENPALAVRMERFVELMHDPSNIIGSLYPSMFKAVGIGFTLHRQGRGWLESDWYREIEAPVDSCWCLEAMIGDGTRAFATVHLTRPRSARPFTADDVQRFDRLRPWLSHAFREALTGGAPLCDDSETVAVTPMLRGQMIVTADEKAVFQSSEAELLLAWMDHRTIEARCRNSGRCQLPAPVLKFLRELIGAANGSSATPPRMEIVTRFGLITLEAKWLMPADSLPGDVAKDPKSCLISVTIELREHALAHAARVLRESGATPAQMKVGIHLASGKSKPEIAETLGVAPSSVASLAKKLYQMLDIHNSTEFAAKVWLGRKQGTARQNFRRTA